MPTLTRLSCAALLALGLAGCPKDKNDDPDPPSPVQLSGAIQKGPFILGAQVQVNVLDATGNPTGTVFNTTTTSETGDFSVQVDPSVVDLVTDGFYYNEATWALSGSDISMRALAEIAAGGPQTTYVNAFTHMTHRRALELYAGGATVADAVAQAESELLPALFLVPPAGLVSGTDMNLLGGANESNAYLLGVSCYIAHAARLASNGTDIDAQVQQLVNTYASDLEGDGAIDQTFIDTHALGLYQDPDECAASLQARLDALGDTTTVLPDPHLAFDWDGDGDPNATDPDDDGDGLDGSSDPVVSVAVLDSDGFSVLRGGSNTALNVVNRRPDGELGYWPGLFFDTADGQTLTNVVEVEVGFGGTLAARLSDGRVGTASGDNWSELPGITTASSLSRALNEELLIVESTGMVTLYSALGNFSQIADIAGAVLVEGCAPNYVYLDNTGAVRILEGATTTDVLGLGGITITDVAIESCAPSSYVAASDTGALYRFTAAAPTAVEDMSITGITGFRTASSAAIFVLTATGVWNLVGDGVGAPRQLTDVPNLTSFSTELAWGGRAGSAYLATDANGDLVVIEWHDDLTLGQIVRKVFIPR